MSEFYAGRCQKPDIYSKTRKIRWLTDTWDESYPAMTGMAQNQSCNLPDFSETK